MNYLAIPSFLGISWMAFVLMRMDDPRTSRRLRLWVAGLSLIQIEAMARFLYCMPSLSQLCHHFAHAAALDAYFLAGVAFLRSSAAKTSRNATGRRYLFLSSVPHLALLTSYAMGVHPLGYYRAVALAALVAMPLLALSGRKPKPEVAAQGAMWLVILVGAFFSARLAAYLSLSTIFALTAAAFAFRLRRDSRGRIVVMTSFALWSLCFLVHPWVAEHHAAWSPMLSEIWDLQRYLVTFGVLIYTLEDRAAFNEFLALHDSLTGLANRTLFESRLQGALARSRRHDSRVLLLNLDLSGFKQINDTFGHPAGDALLKQVAQRLRNATRETDTVARLGGDEFSVLLEDIDNGLRGAVHPDALEQRCDALKAKLRNAIEGRPFQVATNHGDLPVKLEVAIGTAIFPDGSDTAQDLYQRSDECMYRDKRRLKEQDLGAAALA